MAHKVRALACSTIADGAQRVNMFSEPGHETKRVVLLFGAERAALAKPPSGGALLDAGDVELVDHQEPGGDDQAGEVRAGGLKRLDVCSATTATAASKLPWTSSSATGWTWLWSSAAGSIAVT